MNQGTACLAETWKAREPRAFDDAGTSCLGNFVKGAKIGPSRSELVDSQGALTK
jgi:hypothetical protein